MVFILNLNNLQGFHYKTNDFKGFGSEKIQLQDTEEKTRFFPIWKFGSSFKYYPNDYQVYT